jgi:hypothetical protein
MAGGSSNILLRMEKVMLCEATLLILICEVNSTGEAWARLRFEERLTWD